MFSFIHKNCRCLLPWSRRYPRLAMPPRPRVIVTECRRLAAFGLAARFMRDRSGAYAVMFGLMAPVFIGALALGSETGLWYSTQKRCRAADSSAISAAVGVIAGNTNWTLQANATAASEWLCQRLKRHGGYRE